MNNSMKVKELIECLNKFSPEDEVAVMVNVRLGKDENFQDNIIDVSKLEHSIILKNTLQRDTVIKTRENYYASNGDKIGSHVEKLGVH